MKNIPTELKNPNGLHQKYYVQKLRTVLEHSGFDRDEHTECTIIESVDENAEYFVLRLDDGASDMKHVEACRIAINAYAKAIKEHIPQLSKDLIERYPLK